LYVPRSRSYENDDRIQIKMIETEKLRSRAREKEKGSSLRKECKRATEIDKKHVRILPELILHCSVLASSSLSKLNFLLPSYTRIPEFAKVWSKFFCPLSFLPLSFGVNITLQVVSIYHNMEKTRLRLGVGKAFLQEKLLHRHWQPWRCAGTLTVGPSAQKDCGL